MIAKLRRHFILINMSMLAAVLFIVVIAVLSSAAAKLEKDGDIALQDALHRVDAGMEPRRPRIEAKMSGFSRVAFSVIMDAQGRLITGYTNAVDIDASVLQDAAAIAAANPGSGAIAAYGLRYMTREMHGDTLIAFISSTGDTQTLYTLALALVGGSLAGLILFYVICRVLANRILKPVERSWTQQRQFISDASHELKTPLTIILANLNLIGAHESESVRSQRKWLDSTQAEAARMRALVDDLLFLARSDETRVEYAKEELSVTDIAWQTTLAFEPVAFERRVSIQSDICDGLRARGDASRIRQAMSILMDNACKYALEGTAVLVELNALAGSVRFSVHNAGANMTDEQLSHVFERFYRADSSRARSAGGYGLGLPIARVIAQAHGGQLEAENDKAGGVTFVMTLPAL